MGVCYSVQVDINPKPNTLIINELEVYHVYNYNIEDPEEPNYISNSVNYIKNCSEPTENIYEDNF